MLLCNAIENRSSIEDFSNGIEVNGYDNTIGGTTAGAGNVLSGNSNDGVLIDVDISGVSVEGNYIGTDITGSKAQANSIGVEDDGTDNTVGGSVKGAGNIISGNAAEGVPLDSDAFEETIEGNYIGLNVTGKSVLANGSNGIEVQGIGNTIGGDSGSDYYVRNFVSGNANDGVLIDSAAYNQVLGNFIGLDISGTHSLGNVANGVEILGDGNNVGATTPGFTNFISGNKNDGVLLDSMAANNAVQGNDVGTD